MPTPTPSTRWSVSPGERRLGTALAVAFLPVALGTCSDKTRPVRQSRGEAPSPASRRAAPPRLDPRPRPDATRAERAIRQAILIKRAQDALALGHAEAALGHLREAERLLPGSARAAEIQILMGRAYDAQSKPQQALAAYEKAAALSPEDPASHYLLALGYRAAGKPERALSAMDKAVQLSPGSLTYRFDRVSILLALGRKAEANRAFSYYERLRDDRIAETRAGPLRQRLSAVAAVGGVLADEKNRAALTALLSDPEPRVRAAAANVLGDCPVPDAQVLAALSARLAKEQDPEVRKALRRALGRLPALATGPPAVASPARP